MFDPRFDELGLVRWLPWTKPWAYWTSRRMRNHELLRSCDILEKIYKLWHDVCNIC